MELVRNSVLSLILHVADRAANAVTFILIGRRLGAASAGAFQLATTYLLFFSVLTRGLDELVMRQVAQSPRDAKRYFYTFLALRTVLATLLCGVLVVTVSFGLSYPPRTVALILVVSLCVIPNGLTSAANAVIQGLREFSIPAAVAVGVCTVRLALGGLLVFTDMPLTSLSVVWCLSSVAGAATSVALVGLRIRRLPGRCTFDRALVRRELSSMVPFIANGFLMAVEFQIDTILLSVLGSESDVGWYGAATTIIFTLTMIPQAYRKSVYPLMASLAAQSQPKLKRLYELSIRYLGTLALPAVAGIILLAPGITGLVYRTGFLPTVTVLRYLAVILLSLFLNVPSVRMMFVHDRQNWVMWMLAGSMLINVTLNLALTPTLGVRGAALARVSSSLAFFLANYLVLRFVVAKLDSSLFRLLWRPAVSTMLMSAAVWVLRDVSVLIAIPIGIIVYAGALLLLGGVPADDLGFIRQSFQSRRRPMMDL